MNYNFANAEEIIITGLSAGGIGAFLWSSYVKTIVNHPEVVVSIPDSAALVLFKSYENEPIL